MSEAKTMRPDLERRYINACDSITKVQERIDKLRTYSANSKSFFEEYKTCQQQYLSGLAQVQNSKAWNSASGTFDLGLLDMSWAVGINERWKDYQERHMFDSEKLEKNLKEQFGFNSEQAQLLMSIYEKLKEKFGIEDADKLFWQLMATPAYTITKKDAAMWYYTAGLSKTDFTFKLGILGYSNDEIDAIKRMLLNQYNLCAGTFKTPEQYYNSVRDKEIPWKDLSESKQKYYADMLNQFNNTVDFSHMAAIIASYMNHAPMEDSLGETLGLFNGIGGLNENSSYIGDVAGVLGENANLGNDDYYSELKQGNTNRADEFVENIGNGSYKEGISILQQQYNDFLNSGAYKNIPPESQKVFAEFFFNIMNSNNSMK